MAERGEGGLTEAEERISVELACRIARISRTEREACPLNGLMIFFFFFFPP